ncbi:MAG: hypothetical protein ACYCVM_00400 [Acidiferrobacter sp.]
MSTDKMNAASAAEVLSEAAFETLTDEMIGRLAQAASQGLDMLDDVQRHRIAEILPVLGQLAASGDLARLAHLARLLGAAEDALTDDLVVRLAGLASRTMTLMDRLGRLDDGYYARMWGHIEERLTPALLDRGLQALPVVLDLLERASEGGALANFVDAATKLPQDLATVPRPSGGIAGLWTLMKDAENQRVLQALLLYARRALKIGGTS